jgi:hypothetical protein
MLGIEASAAQWVLDAYQLVFASLLLMDGVPAACWLMLRASQISSQSGRPRV